MNARTLLMILTAVCFSLICLEPALAQGGWDVWTVRMRDGSEVSAAPVWSLDDKELRHSFGDAGGGKGYAVPRSSILYMSNNLGNSEYRRVQGAAYKKPTLPEGDVKQDLVVMDDGRHVSGKVTIRAGTDKSGSIAIYNPVLVQNGVETALIRVAFIKFAADRNATKKRK